LTSVKIRSRDRRTSQHRRRLPFPADELSRARL